jgi:hypothetical protein
MPQACGAARRRCQKSIRPYLYNYPVRGQGDRKKAENPLIAGGIWRVLGDKRQCDRSPDARTRAEGRGSRPRRDSGDRWRYTSCATPTAVELTAMLPRKILGHVCVAAADGGDGTIGYRGRVTEDWRPVRQPDATHRGTKSCYPKVRLLNDVLKCRTYAQLLPHSTDAPANRGKTVDFLPNLGSGHLPRDEGQSMHDK